MNKYIYNRISKEHQQTDQQMNAITSYLNRIGGNIQDYTVISETVSGTKNHTDRELYNVIESLRHADTNSSERIIIVSELSRLGRNMTDLFNIVNKCTEYGIKLIQAKDSTIIENDSIGGKALLFALSLAAEIEVANLRQRTKAGLAATMAKGTKIGRASDNYGKGENFEQNQIQGRLNAAISRNENFIHSKTTIAFAKVLLRNIPEFKANEAPEPLFFINWDKCTFRLTNAQKEQIKADMETFYPDMCTDFPIKQIPNRVYSLIRAISKYKEFQSNNQ